LHGRRNALLSLAAVAVALVAWASRDMLLDGHAQWERKRCCQRMRVCSMLLQSFADQHQPMPTSLHEWIAEDPNVAEVFLDDAGCYEIVPPQPGDEMRDPASTVILVEKKATHSGLRHALFADLHVDVAPGE
jgi:prepilin-type processing-associated H-X9-DG protein